MSMKVRRYKGLLFISVLFFIVSACTDHSEMDKTNSVFFIVQPPEHFSGFNGHLNWYGRDRAGDLMRFLKDSGIQQIYANGLAASRETIDSLKKLKGHIGTVEFPIDSVAGHLFDLLKEKEDFGRRILIISREKQIDSILRKLGWTATTELHPKEKFNLIYRLENNKGKASLRKIKYGRVPRPIMDTAKSNLLPADSLKE